MKRSDFSDKNIVVMGLGQFGGGVDSAIFSAGLASKVIVTDIAKRNKLKTALKELEKFENIEYKLGGHSEDDFRNADIVIVNPAVPAENKFVKIAKENGAVITSQIEIFFGICPAKTVGITGSNGKSTTTALTAHLLDANPKKMRTYDKVYLGGNIGNKKLLAIVDNITENDVVVLELSSFQLEQLARIEKSPNISLITNVTPNHLDRHETMENYQGAKENIFNFQESGDVAIFNSQNKASHEMFYRFSVKENIEAITYSSEDVSDRIKEVYRLAGEANLSNLAGAVAIAKALGVGNKTIKKAAGTFRALPHRLELISKKDGIRWYNDSISTTPESTIVALEAFTQPKILIAGGYDKGVSFEKLGAKIAELAKAVILIGQTADKIKNSIPKSSVVIENAETLEDAVTKAKELAEKGDAVLLSPACASYDMFTNFQQRGELFGHLVKHK